MRKIQGYDEATGNTILFSNVAYSLSYTQFWMELGKGLKNAFTSGVNPGIRKKQHYSCSLYLITANNAGSKNNIIMSIKSFIAEFLIFFLLVNTLIVSFLCIDMPEVEVNAGSIVTIILKFGVVFSIPVSLLLTGAHFLCIKTAKNTIVKILIAIIVIAALYCMYYAFFWYVGISGLIDDPLAK